jgi:hypothetical protein
MTASEMLKQAVFKPIPIARVRIAVTEKPGDFHSCRTA